MCINKYKLCTYICMKIYTNHSLKALLTHTHHHDDLTVPERNSPKICTNIYLLDDNYSVSLQDKSSFCNPYFINFKILFQFNKIKG